MVTATCLFWWEKAIAWPSSPPRAVRRRRSTNSGAAGGAAISQLLGGAGTHQCGSLSKVMTLTEQPVCREATAEEHGDAEKGGRTGGLDGSENYESLCI